MSQENEAKVRRFYDEVQKGNLSVIDELVGPNFVDRNPAPGQAPGAEGVRAYFTALRAALTNLQITVEKVVAEGDLAAAHISIRGKHTGDLMGLPPSGKDVVARVSDIVRFENGKAVERWGVEDMSGFVSQG